MRGLYRSLFSGTHVICLSSSLSQDIADVYIGCGACRWWRIRQGRRCGRHRDPGGYAVTVLAPPVVPRISTSAGRRAKMPTVTTPAMLLISCSSFAGSMMSRL